MHIIRQNDLFMNAMEKQGTGMESKSQTMIHWELVIERNSIYIA